jgi:purine-binding chemotaxis protein CheW
LAAKQQFASCFVDELCFGIEVEKVQEVRGMTGLTRVPLAPRVVAGLINLRGRIVTAIDLRRCLELNDRPAGQLAMNLILKSDDGWVSLLVDRIGDVLEVTEDDFELPPKTLRGRPRDLIRGAYKLDAGLLLALDTDMVLKGLTEVQKPVLLI